LATSSHSFKGGIADEIGKIADTPGFRVEDTGLTWKVINIATGASKKVHKGGREHVTPAVLSQIRRIIGWTPELYEESQMAERSARMAEAKRVEHRTNAFIASLEAPLDGGAKTEDTQPSESETRGKGIATVIDVNKNPIDIGLDVPEQLGSCSLRFEWITPELAQAYLDTRVEVDSLGRLGQRPVSQVDVIEWARIIKNGLFRFVPDPILFDENGACFNGQHRMLGFLMAVEQGYDNDLPMLVGYNWPRDLFMVVDHGRKRTTAQTLAIMNETNTAQLAATVKQAHCLLNVRDQSLWPKVKMVDREVIQFLEDHPQIRRSHKLVQQARTLGFNRTAYCAAHYYLTIEVRDSGPVDEFFGQLYEGDGLHKGTAIYALREFMLRGDDRRVTASIARVPKGKLHLYYLIKAWNNTQKGAYVTTPGYRSPGIIPEVRPYVPPRERAKNAPPEE
jgi:hypothetical protein